MPSVLGYISMETMDVLLKLDERFKRVFYRNFYMLMIEWVRHLVPLLS